MNRQSTLPLDAAVQSGVAGGGGVPSTRNVTLSAGILVVVVDVVAVDVVVVVGGALVVVVVATEVVAIEEVVVTGSGPSLPQPAPARTIAAISAARKYACDASPWVPDTAITVPSVPVACVL
jgi:hypothetical protein